MRVTVFGGAGFLGSHLTDSLSANGHQVTVFDARPNRWLQDCQRQVFGDIRSPAQLAIALEGADALFNCAAIAHLDESRLKPRETLDINVMGHLAVLEAAEKASVKHIVYASSLYAMSACGSFYGLSKRTAEELTEEFARRSGMTFTIVRYGSLYGERTDERNPNTVYGLVRQALETGAMRYEGRASDVREFLHVRDAAAMSASVITTPEFANRHLVLTGHERLRMADLMQMVQEVIRRDIKIEIAGKDRGHYQTTPYAYRPAEGKKVVPSTHVDLGQGILSLVHEVSTSLSMAGV